MNLQEQQFDELMREKLAGYSEPPDFSVLPRIHAKKIRVMSWYGLTRILVIASLVGLGLWGGMELAQNEKLIVDSVSTETNQTSTELNAVSDNHANDLQIWENGNTNTNKNNSDKILTNEKTNTSLNTDKSKANKVSVQTKINVKNEDALNATNKNEQTQTVNTETSNEKTAVQLSDEDEDENSAAEKIISEEDENKAEQQADSTNIINTKQSLKLKGIVRGGIGEYINSTVELLSFNQSRHGYEIIATTKADANGEFEFNSIKGGNYLLRAYPSQYENGYVVTYWGGSREADFAGEIHVSANDNDLTGYTIDLIFDSKAKSEELVKNPFSTKDAGKTIFIYDQNNNLVGTTTTDENGNFNISHLPDGDYSLVNPETGKTSQTSSSNGNMSGNISDDFASENAKVSVSPNPAVDMVKIGVNTPTEELATIVIVNNGGVEVARITQGLIGGFNQSQIDISFLPAGIYYVMIIRSGKEIISGRLSK